MCEIYGKIVAKWFPVEQIPEYVVEYFFLWKYERKGRRYDMTVNEYLRTYYVTEAVLIFCGMECISINFFCRVNKTAYLENMAFNMKYEEYSPGLIGYYFSLCELSRQKCERLYLGGGNYQYKNMFSSKSKVSFSGIIYSDYFFDLLNEQFRINRIHEYYIFGGGRNGKAFLGNKNKINARLEGCIDYVKRDLEGIKCMEWGKQDISFPKCIIVTTHEYDSKFLDELRDIFEFVFYWNDMTIGDNT